MEAAIKKYAQGIEKGVINPVYPCEGKTGKIIDSKQDSVPLVMLDFGRWVLSAGDTVEQKTGDCEFVVVPMAGEIILSQGGSEYRLGRKGGPFQAKPGKSNASAFYIPVDESFQVTGNGECIWYSAPSSGGTAPIHIPPDAKAELSRGSLTWRRDVITLVEPGVESTNLVVGETYSPPGLWSGTPLHVHDRDAITEGQSDHEEIYYHVMRVDKSSGRDAPYTVQMLFDGETVNKAYIMRDKYAFAIPGASHPVVASPVSDSLYGWALAGKEGSLGMWDIPEFAYLKKVGSFIDDLEKDRGLTKLEKRKIDDFCRDNDLGENERAVLVLNLQERGFVIE